MDEKGVDLVIFKKSAMIGEKNGVSYMNGKVSLQGFSMNVYSYLIDGVLIDTGARSLHKYFESFIDHADFDQVLITHHHEDHTGCAAYIEKTKKTPIYINEKSINICTDKADYPFYRKAFWGIRMPFHTHPTPTIFQSRNATWDVIDTPGHAFDHQSFLNRETGQLFTGDLFVQVHTKLLLSNESIPTIIQSLEKVLSFDFNEVICQHAGFVNDGRIQIQKKLDYLVSIQQEVMELNKIGYSASEICGKLFPKKYPIIKLSRGEWDSLHIVNSILNESIIQNDH
ncbi:beta-lactamase [Ureibacillus manganicus DSM 26584]|uniref:Beta-lactamase n=1 Tax=Ureibacillus manganicus DSM 26584 TaxID=1384049 RepID=A0A0A3I4Z4_9BACL|nr:beta-lactamase [Ureibacillus manganicus DSM 26584]